MIPKVSEITMNIVVTEVAVSASFVEVGEIVGEIETSFATLKPESMTR